MTPSERLEETRLRIVEPLIRPGDVVAFSGTGPFSRCIKFFTRSAVSHIGIVIEAGPALEVCEALNTVEVNGLYDSITSYEGEAWILCLSDEARQRLDLKRMGKFLRSCIGKRYDTPQMLK
jgi:hypothetical protein